MKYIISIKYSWGLFARARILAFGLLFVSNGFASECKMEIAPLSAFDQLPLETKVKIVEALPIKDQLNLRVTCSALKRAVEVSLLTTLKPLYDGRRFYLDENVLKGQMFLNHSPKCATRLLEDIKEPFLNIAKDFFGSTGYLCQLKYNPFTIDLNSQLVTPKLAKVKQLLDLMSLKQRNEFRSCLFGKAAQPGKINLFQKAILQHVLNQYSFYVSSNITTRKKNLLVNDILEEGFLERIKNLQEQRSYLSYRFIAHQSIRTLSIMLAKKKKIVITATDLLNPVNKKCLEIILSLNPEHTLLLIADNQVVTNGVLNLSASDLPKSLKHLIMSDPKQIVKSLGNNFLYNANLKSLESSGLMSRFQF